MKNYFIRGSVLALALAAASAGSLYAQSSQAPQPDQSQANTQQQPDEKAFTGVIVKDGGSLVLQDPASKVSYKVDDESKVKDYLGKQVKIVGSLDASTNVIHVDSIEIVS